MSVTVAPGLCEDCGKPARDRQETLAGRLLCEDCYGALLATSVAVVQGGGIAEGIAAGGLKRRLAWFRRRGKPGRPDL